MVFSTKSSTILLSFASYACAAYYGGIVAGPFQDPTTDSVYCPPGTVVGSGVVWCCPAGTVFDASTDAGALCCPTSADCSTDLLNSGIQCADPSMTLWKMGGSLICCPAGYYLNDNRVCTNVGSPNLYTTTAQTGHLTVEASAPSGTATGVSPVSNSAAATSNSAAATSSANETPAPSATSGNTGSKTSGVASSTSKAAAANLDAGLGGLLTFVGGLMFL